METFFAENGKKNLLFVYGEHDSNTSANAPNTTTTTANAHNTQAKLAAKQNKTKVQIADSSSLVLKGVCVFFVRNSTSIAITVQNISQV